MNILNISSRRSLKSKHGLVVSILRSLHKWPLILPIIIFSAMFVVMISLMGNSLSVDLLTSILQTTLPLIIVGLGQTLVILIGGIDLGVGGIMSLSTALLATQMTQNQNMAFWIPCVLVLGFVIGFLDGYVIVKTGIQPFIVTMAMWTILSGIALKVLPSQGGSVSPALINFAYSSFLELNSSFWIVVVIIIIWVIIKRTRFGVSVYATGSSETAAGLNGLNVGRTKIWVYAISGLCAAIAGIYFAALTNSGSSIAGDPFIMRSVAAVVIGGTSLVGGRGNFLGTLLGALILSFITLITFFAGAQSAYAQLFQGIMLIAAMIIYSSVTILTHQFQLREG